MEERVTDDVRDLTDEANLRVAFNVLPKGVPLPSDVDETARLAIALLQRDLLYGDGAPINVVRFAKDGVSLWLLDNLSHISIEDFVRAVARAFEPHAFAIAVLQPMTKVADKKVYGLHCRAAHGDALIELRGDAVDGAIDEARSIPSWQLRRGQATTDDGRWIGVPPKVWVALPMITRHEA